VAYADDDALVEFLAEKIALAEVLGFFLLLICCGWLGIDLIGDELIVCLCYAWF
jgi:hypothetical protein